MNSRLVLAIASDPQNKEFIRKALASANFKVSFIGSIMEITDSIVHFKPCAVVQDWGAVDESQARQFHLKFPDKEISVGIMRIIIAPTVSPALQIFAKDALVDDVMSYANAKLNLGNELDKLFFIEKSSPLHKLMKEIKSGKQKYSQKELDDKIEDAVKQFPQDTSIQLEFGGLCLRREQYDESKKQSTHVLHKDPSNVRALNLLARSLMKSGNFGEAVKILEKANLLSPKNSSRLMLLGDAFYGDGDIQKALDCYQEAKIVDEDMALDSDRKSGAIHLEKGDIDAALALFKESLSEDESASIFNNVAVAAVKIGHFDEALNLYSTALKTLHTSDQYRAQILFNIALCYFRMNDKLLANKFLKKTLRVDPNFSKAISLSKKIAA